MIKRPIRLSDEERKLLEASPIELLRLMTDIKEHKYFSELKAFYAEIRDVEMGYFFTKDESVLTDEKLGKLHAYARGRVETLRQMIRLFLGSQVELARREALLEQKKKERSMQ